jgi:hypothetical protein
MFITRLEKSPSFSTHAKNFFHILSKVPAEIIMNLLAFIVVPIALLSCDKTSTRLPRWARLWDDYEFGINGDLYWQGPKHADGKQNTYYWRLLWLFRNRAMTFAHQSGANWSAEDVLLNEWSIYGDEKTSNRPVGHSGFLYIELKDSAGKKYPCYYYVRQLFNTGRCIRFYAGYKLLGIYERPEKLYAQYVVSFNPLMGFAKS